MSEIIWSLSFSDWLISLGVMFSRAIRAVGKGENFPFLQPRSTSLYKCTVVSPTHLRHGGHLGCLQILAIVNNENSQCSNFVPFILFRFPFFILHHFTMYPNIYLYKCKQQRDSFIFLLILYVTFSLS